MKEQVFKFDLQRFTEGKTGAADSGGDHTGKDGQSNDEGKSDAKTYIQADIDAALTAKLAEEKRSVWLRRTNRHCGKNL